MIEESSIDSLSMGISVSKDEHILLIVASVVILILLVAVVILIVRCSHQRKVNSTAQKLKRDSRKASVDFDNILNSGFNSEPLYKELIVKCHPDRFAGDEEKIAIATDLSSRITKNKHDVKKLQELKEESKQKLNINF